MGLDHKWDGVAGDLKIITAACLTMSKMSEHIELAMRSLQERPKFTTEAEAALLAAEQNVAANLALIRATRKIYSKLPATA